MLDQKLTDLIKTHECLKCGAIHKSREKPLKCYNCESTLFKLIAEEVLTIEEATKIFRETFDNILSFLKRYVDMPIEQMKIVTLWIMSTYLHDNFNTFPFLFLNAMRGSGKTRLLKIISHLQKNGNGDLQNNISEAVLFRTAKERGLIIDEFEGIGSKDKTTLRELLNAAYKKGGKVRRMRKKQVDKEERQVVEEFDLFTPIAMANIWGIEEILQDRCLTIVLEKSQNQAITKKLEDFDTNSTLKDIKRTLDLVSCSLCSVVMGKKHLEHWNNYIDNKYSLYINIHNTLNTYNYINTEKTKEEIEEEELFNKIDEVGIDGRNLELLLPLIIVAGFLDSQTFEEILVICKDIVKGRKTEEFAESKDVSLYEFISTCESYRFNPIFVKGLTLKFREFLGEMQDDDKWLNDKWVGRSLKRLNLITSKKRVSNGIEVTVNVEKAKEKLKMFKELIPEDKDASI